VKLDFKEVSNDISTLWGKKCTVFIFCNNFVKPRYILIIFGTKKPLLLPRNIIAKVQCLLLALRHALKQYCHWSIGWSVKLCWLLTTYQSHAALQARF